MPSTPSSATSEATDLAGPDAAPPRLGRRGLLVAIAAGAVAIVIAALAVVLITSAGDNDERGAASSSLGPHARETHVGSGPADVGQPAPDFTLPGLDRGTVALSDFAGKPVLVNFWASWCHPCRKEFPLFEAALAKHQRDGLEIIGVSYQDIPSDGRAFVAGQGATWSFGRDPGGALATAYGVRAVPQTFFVDADGKVVSRLFGISSGRDLEAEIQKILPKHASD